MVIQNANGSFVQTPRTTGQKLVRLVWRISKTVASVGLTIALLAMVPQLALAFFALIGIGYVMWNGANMVLGLVKGVAFGLGAVVATIWRGL